VLIIFSGRSGTGKTAIARELSRQLGAVHLRVDSIEQPIRDSGVAIEDVGYRVAYAVAEDNLRLGRTVIADCVNPWPLTRDAWLAVADRAEVRAVEIEITCSDAAVHRTRVESRTVDIPGLVLPTWQQVVNRDYRRWDRHHLVIDTAHQTVEESVATLRAAIPAQVQ
jgi:predicted kinase